MPQDTGTIFKMLVPEMVILQYDFSIADVEVMTYFF